VKTTKAWREHWRRGEWERPGQYLCTELDWLSPVRTGEHPTSFTSYFFHGEGKRKTY
jgi:hypothetical protein